MGIGTKISKRIPSRIEDPIVGKINKTHKTEPTNLLALALASPAFH